ncbi:hypothetical protein [Anaerosacchariphilus polymeriproducens]|uniref:hypothetical protein n=1 Tax=Anaerosacchariphilus polymeriproducens TaxID=1812858 RepID=UPI0011C05559|nr:hypothetical protein [Anaerosacchariphilus polymeriproducens]
MAIRYLLRLGDKKAQEEIERYHKPFNLESIEKKYISGLLTEWRGKLDEKYGKILEILIINECDMDIRYIKGYIALYEGVTKISKIDFEINNLTKSYKERIFYELMDDRISLWDGFDIYISEIKFNEVEEKDIKIKGNRKIRTHFFVLNLDKFYDFKFLGIRTTHNLIWIKKKFKMIIIDRIKFICRRRVFHIGQKPPLKEELLRCFRIAIFLPLIIFIVSILPILVVFDFVKLFIELFEIWKSIL